jgi:hypothetical protein
VFGAQRRLKEAAAAEFWRVCLCEAAARSGKVLSCVCVGGGGKAEAAARMRRRQGCGGGFAARVSAARGRKRPALIP